MDAIKKKKIIRECYKYGVLKKSPSKMEKDWFCRCYECGYPRGAEDVSDKIAKHLKKNLKIWKDKEKFVKKCRRQRKKRGYSDFDARNISQWLLEIMPEMLKKMRKDLHGRPAGMMEWEKVLDRMIFLLGEMDENKCSYKNRCEKEFDKANRDFEKKYGFYGEKLKAEEELEAEKKSGYSRFLSPSDFPELCPGYAELRNGYFVQEKLIDAYRDRCKEEFFDLFSEHFWELRG